MVMKTRRRSLVQKIYLERDSFSTILEQNCTEYKDHLSRGSVRLWLITRVKVLQSVKNVCSPLAQLLCAISSILSHLSKLGASNTTAVRQSTGQADD